MTKSKPMSLSARGRQKGVSLLTIALLLLMMGGALLAGLSYFRASLPSDTASIQRESLVWADKAIVGFASIHHRLPCPAKSQGGEEDCTLKKGWLPVKALNLDVTMFAAGTLAMRYMVYEGLGEFEVVGTRKVVPNSYEPKDWNEDSTQDPDAFKDVALKTDASQFPTHTGRFSDAYDFGARNGLDMCEEMREAAVKTHLAGGKSADQAHYVPKSTGTVTNVAYGIALPGMTGSGGNAGFDGENASDNPKMEAPDKQHDSSYDDQVFVRDISSLMSAFGCQPVHYKISNWREDNVGGLGSGFPTGLVGFVGAIAVDIQNIIDGITAIGDGKLPDSHSKVYVNYDREGIAAPMHMSVQSVAMAVTAVDEVLDQFEGVKAAAADMLAWGIVDAVLSTASIIVSVVSMIADAIGIVKAVALAIASFGFHAGAYVAIVAYSIALGLNTAALAVNIAGLDALIAGTLAAGGIALYMDDADALSKMKKFCDTVESGLEQGSSELDEAMKEQLKKAEETRDKAKEKLELVITKIEAARGRVDTCYTKLDEYQHGSDLSLAGCSNPSSYSPSICQFPDEQYKKFYNRLQPDAISSALDMSTERNVLFNQLYDAKSKLKMNEKEIDDLEDKIDRIESDITNLDSTVEAYRDQVKKAQEKLLPAQQKTDAQIEAEVNKYREALKKQYQKDLTKAQTDLANAKASTSALRAAETSAKNAIADAVNGVKDAVVSDKAVWCQSSNSYKTVPCAQMYTDACNQARSDIIDRYRNRTANSSMPLACDFTDMFNPEKAAMCNYYNYAVLWEEYYARKDAYKRASDAYESMKGMGSGNIPGSPPCSSSDNGYRMWIWTRGDLYEAGALEVLRRVDKRGVLQ